VICSNKDGRPGHVLIELDASWLTAPPEAALPGYVCVVAKRHVVEPFELSDEEQNAFWNDCMFVARALVRLFEPRKMNYEIHGNTIPHLHMHLYPRYAGDPYEGGAITGATGFMRTTKQLEQIGDAVRRTRA
jgi:diadenosine tetraphosphate (Ap4A) HIT family hydrolase